MRLLSLLAMILCCGLALNRAVAADLSWDITVNAGEYDRVESPAVVVLDLPSDVAKKAHVHLTDGLGRVVLSQSTGLGLLSPHKAIDGTTPIEVHFTVLELPANEEWKLVATVKETAPEAVVGFTWSEKAGKSMELQYSGQPVLRYMYEALDDSTPERRAETYKMYHHVFAPSGVALLTKGAGGLFPHHRGLFYGFNRISYGDDRKADTWHCTNGAYLAHTGFLASEAGPVLGRHRVSIDWHGQESEVFAQEEREMAAHDFPEGTLIEFASRLRSTVGPVKLDGDPQHAGFQFRAAQEVAETTNKQTYYLRPQGQGAPGETLNWPEAKEMVNLPWHAMSCVIGGERYTIAMLDRAANPKESRFSERDYGRFGSYFEFGLDETRPLELSYRVWVQAGEMTADQIAAKSLDFAHPVSVTATVRK